MKNEKYSIFPNSIFVIDKSLILTPPFHLEPGRVREIGFGTLRVVESPMADGAPSCPDGEFSAIELVSASVSVFGCLVHELVKSRENVVCELDLRDRPIAGYCQPNAKASNALLTERRVEHPSFAKFVLKSDCATENTAECHVFAKAHGTRIIFQRDVQRLIDCLTQICLFSLCLIIF